MTYPNAQTRIDSHLTEGKQVGTLYHWTDYQSVKWILTDNAIEGYTGKSGIITISATRDRQLLFRKGAGFLRWRFVLDGDRISDKYKIRPYAELGYARTGDSGSEAEQRVILRPGQSLGPLKKYVMRLEHFGPVAFDDALDRAAYFKENGEKATMGEYGYKNSGDMWRDLFTAETVVLVRKLGIKLLRKRPL